MITRATDTGEPYEVDTVGSGYINKLHREGHGLRTQLADAIRERDEALSLLAFHGHKIEAARNCGQLGMPQGDCDCSVCRSFFAERDALRSDLAKVTAERDELDQLQGKFFADSLFLRIEVDKLRLLIEAKDKALRACHPANIWDRARMYYQGPGPDTITRDWHNERCEQVNKALALTPDSLTEELRALREGTPSPPPL